METWQLAVYAGACFIMAILSGIAGGGAGFVTTPLAILLGLSPAQAVSTNKFNGLSESLGSLGGMFDGHRKARKRKVIPVMVMAGLVGLVTPYIIRSLDSGFYRIALGIILLLMVPLVVSRRVGLRRYRPARWQRIVGRGLLTLSLFLQGVFSSGLGVLVNLVLMGMLGMNAIEANITRRWSQLILDVTIILGLVGSGLIVWQLALAGSAAALSGSYIGSRIAVTKGNRFIMRITVVLMLVSSLMLILSAS